MFVTTSRVQAEADARKFQSPIKRGNVCDFVPSRHSLFLLYLFQSPIKRGNVCDEKTWLERKKIL